MELNEEKITQLIEEVSLFKEINLSEIPAIDLYMDQITTFFDNKLGHLKRNEKDVILTKTMINNYTKGKILMPPDKKKYSKDHIILLILIYYLKQTISINDIESLLSPIIKDITTPKEDDRDLDNLYSAFLELKKEEVNSFERSIKEKSGLIKEKAQDSNFENQESAELFLMVIMLLNQADLHKRLAEKIIDNFYSKNNQKKK